jgi:hypothetical protein
LLLAILGPLGGTAAAQIPNGSFEDAPNHLNGWVVGPGARVEALVGSDFGSTPVPVPDGNWLTLISNGPGNVPTAPGGDFDGNGTGDNDSSTLSTTFTTVASGERLSFAWAFVTDEVGPGGQGQAQYDDLFDISIDGISLVRGSVRKPGGLSPFPDTVAYDGQRYTVNSSGLTDNSDFGSAAGGGRTPFQQVCITISDPGTYTLQFLVADQADSVFDSGLLVDDVRVGTTCNPTVQVTQSDQTLTSLKGGSLVFTAVNNGTASSSGDGTTLAFRSNGDYAGDNPGLQEQIWLARRSGTAFGISRLTAAVDEQFGDPDISADGRWLAFASTADLGPPGNADRNLEIFRYDIANGTFLQLTDTAGCANEQPSINDGGGRVAFVSDCDLGFSASSAEIVYWDGTFRGVDTSGCESRDPRVARDSVGRYVTFVTDCDGPYGASNPDRSLEVVQWDTQTELYLEVTVTPAGHFSDGVFSNADGRFLSLISDADHQAGENPAGDWVVFRYDRLADSFLQLVDPDPDRLFISSAIDPSGLFVAAERVDVLTAAFDVVLVDAMNPRTELPVALGSASVFNSFPAVGVWVNSPQVVFWSNGDTSGNNPDVNSEIWTSGPTFDPPDISVLCSTPNLPIPDQNGAGVRDVIAVATPGMLVDVDVSLRIEHSRIGDLWIVLTHLDTGTSVRLIDRPARPPGAGCSGDDIDATLDDEAAAAAEDECVTPGPVSISGRFSPHRALSAFDGEDLAGDWELRVSDRRRSNMGTFVEWCLIPATQ